MTKPKKKVRRSRTDCSRFTIRHMVNGQVLAEAPRLKIDAKMFVTIFRKNIEELLCGIGRKKQELQKKSPLQ